MRSWVFASLTVVAVVGGSVCEGEVGGADFVEVGEEGGYVCVLVVDLCYG